MPHPQAVVAAYELFPDEPEQLPKITALKKVRREEAAFLISKHCKLGERAKESKLLWDAIELLEWPDGGRCPKCFEEPDEGHADYCELGALLYGAKQARTALGQGE